MGAINYYTVDGEILGEECNGVRTDYATDALGSVVGTVNQDCEVVNQYWYKPYGGLLSKLSIGADPRFLWVGTSGYRNDRIVYVRQRHYFSEIGTWISRDRLWPRFHPIVYVNSNPVVFVDPTGAAPQCSSISFEDLKIFCTKIPHYDYSGFEPCKECKPSGWCQCSGTFWLEIKVRATIRATGNASTDSRLGLPCTLDGFASTPIIGFITAPVCDWRRILERIHCPGGSKCREAIEGGCKGSRDSGKTDRGTFEYEDYSGIGMFPAILTVEYAAESTLKWDLDLWGCSTEEC